MVKQIHSLDDYQKAIAVKGKLVVIDFTATWCGPCRLIAPRYEKFSEEFVNADFYKVDVDDVTDVAQLCGIRAMPTFIFYKDGSKIDELCGANEGELKKKISAHV
ncbi:Trx2p [Pelobates cultripes]|uniref:Thioredoxin n=1 Tax=Pelobates cultripes TaxID=61616 RepID=A0AAD1R5G0_PELCU|nr:Trx2p [Pelobates cultripes]